jgi:hypothetical protein
MLNRGLKSNRLPHQARGGGEDKYVVHNRCLRPVHIPYFRDIENVALSSLRQLDAHEVCKIWMCDRRLCIVVFSSVFFSFFFFKLQ